MKLLIIFFLLLFQLISCDKMLTVAGKLECCTSDKTPCPVYKQKTEVQIWEKKTIRSDKHLQSTTSDPITGNFLLSVPNTHKIFSFEPYLKIVHNCDAKPGCKRVYIVDVPQVFIRNGWTFSITHLNLRKPFLGGNKDQC
ncbi:Transthyretin domain containing protein [Aphelenchoides bicaudatus]|nr:Transthyretin domain containing protein [Aphelenchoides bicaudatus]